jgi:glycosyltransferase involved in cell wall biosynthesis
MATVGVVSFRLGGADGVSVEAASWCWALRALGHDVVTIAGRGAVDRSVPGLAWPVDDSAPPPSGDEATAALDGCDVVVVENLCSLPLHPPASAAVAKALRGRPALLHHYDLPWERARFEGLGWSPPDDPAWRHICISHHAAATLRRHSGIEAEVEHLRIDPAWADGGRRAAGRQALGLDDGDRLVLQPSRALARKGIADAVALAAAAGAVYWLTGPAEEGYDDELAGILAGAATRVLRGLPEGLAMPDAYAAADAVVVASTWEGFGLPLLEAAVARTPLAVRRYPVAQELEQQYCFHWLPIDDAAALRSAMESPDPALPDANEAAVRTHLDRAGLPARLAALLSGL